MSQHEVAVPQPKRHRSGGKKKPDTAPKVPPLDLSGVGRTPPGTDDDASSTSSARPADADLGDRSPASASTGPATGSSDVGSGGGSDDGSDLGDLGQAFTLLEVSERLIDDLEGHQRGFLLDLKPSRLLTEMATIDRQLEQLTRRSAALTKKITLLDDRADLLELYGQIVASYDEMKSWSKAKGTPAGGLREQKHRIEQRFAAKGRKQLRAKAGQLASQDEQIRAAFDRTEAAILRLHRLKLELQDRSVAFGVHLEERAITSDPGATFPWDVGVGEQLAYIEHWAARFPEVQTAVRGHLAANADMLQATRQVRSTERAYAFEAMSHRQVVDDYDELRKPGTSMSQSVKITFTAGEGLEGGAFVQVTGSVAAGDDRKVRPSLAFKVGLVGKIDFGLWEASASIGVTYAMTEGYQSLEHFAAHYMRLLSLYNFSFKRYAQLQSQLSHLPDDPKTYAAARERIIDEAHARGFVGENDAVLVGTEDEQQLAKLQALPPVQVRSLMGDVEVGVGPTDQASGFAEYLGGFAFSISYTRKWFTRLVEYDQFVMANGDTGGELQRLRDLRRDYVALVDRLDRVRRDIRSAVVGGVPPDLRKQEAELANLKNVYEEGHLTIFRRGRKAFLAELDERIEALSTAPDAGRSGQTAEGVHVEDVRLVNDRAKKKLTKTGSVTEVAIDGSFKAGGLALKLAGKYSDIANDANPDNDGTYLNFSLELGTDASGEALDMESDAGQKALAAIEEAGTFDVGVIEPTASAVTGQLVTNLASGVESFGGALAGGVKVEANLVKQNGGFRCQYVRVTRSRTISTEVKAKTPYGMNVAFAYEGGKTDFVAEWMGSSTLSYLQTIYNGLQGHPDPEGEWQAYLKAHRPQVWKLLLATMTYATNTREELLGMAGGKRLFDTWFERVSSYRHRSELGVGDLTASSGTPPLDTALYDGLLQGLTRIFDTELAARGSLQANDLREAGWQSAEGAVHSKVTQVFGRDYRPLDKPIVASTNKLTRGIKGETTATGLAQYGTFGALVDAGARVKLVLQARGRTSLDLVFDPQVEQPKAIAKAAAKLQDWLPSDEQDEFRRRLQARSLTHAVEQLLDAAIPA